MKSWLGALVGGLLLASPAAADQLRAIDGDTVALGDEHIRLMGFDAPELHGSKCDAEHMLAMVARDRLAALIAAPDVEIIRGGKPDKYGRTLAVIRAGGVDVARIMISEHLARPYHGEKRQSWCEAAR